MKRDGKAYLKYHQSRDERPEKARRIMRAFSGLFSYVQSSQLTLHVAIITFSILKSWNGLICAEYSAEMVQRFESG